jgi:hypothetical protein
MSVLSKMADAKEDEEYAVAFKKCKVLVTVPKSPQIGASSSSSSSSTDSEKVGRVLPERVANFTDDDIDYFKRLPTELKKEIVASFPPFTPSKEWLEAYEKWRAEEKTRYRGTNPLCNFVDENGDLCTKQAQPSSQFTGIPGRCVKHDGGNRCQKKGCETSAQTSERCTGLPGMCVVHGGGTRCEYEYETEGEINVQNCCPNGARNEKGGTPGMCKQHGGTKTKTIHKKCLSCGENEARGSTRKTGIPGMCRACGGDNRCEKPCCTALPGIPTVAVFIHPDTGEGICTAFARNMVAEALFEKNDEEVQRLMNYFGFKRKLVFRAEQAFFCALNKAVPELRQFESAIDTSVLKQFYDKTKSTEDRRPDAFFLCRETNVGLHFEYDENTYHEDDDARLTLIANQAGCGPDAVYVVRVNGRQDINDPLCVRRNYKEQYAYYKLTERGNEVVAQVAEYMKECVDMMKLGILPTTENKKRYF